MRTPGLSGVMLAKTVYTTTSAPDEVRAPALVDRNFTSDRPDRLWVADFTYVRTWLAFVYAAFIVDMFAQRIVASNAARTKHTDLVMTPLRMALWQRDREGHPVEPNTLISHSDAGSQRRTVQIQRHRRAPQVRELAFDSGGGDGDTQLDGAADGVGEQAGGSVQSGSWWCEILA